MGNTNYMNYKKTLERRLILCKEGRIGGFLLMTACLCSIVYYYHGIDFVYLLIFWIPVVYCLSSFASKRRQLIESLRESPLFLLVSVRSERGLEFSEKRVQNIIDLEHSNDTYYYTIEETNTIIKMNPLTVGEIKYWCRTYLEATKRFQIFFVLSMTAATFLVLNIIRPFDDSIISIFILMCVLAVGGFFPKVQRTMDLSYGSRRHYHVYTFFPPDVKNPKGVYKCVCGAKIDSKTEEKQERALI